MLPEAANLGGLTFVRERTTLAETHAVEARRSSEPVVLKNLR
jgi:hypothetical protein